MRATVEMDLLSLPWDLTDREASAVSITSVIIDPLLKLHGAGHLFAGGDARFC